MWEQKRGCKILTTLKKGRPTDSPKTNTLKIRIDNNTLNKLDYLVNQNASNRSAEIRKSIESRYDNIKK